MRKFKSPGQAQRFLTVHGLVRNFFRVGMCDPQKRRSRIDGQNRRNSFRCQRTSVSGFTTLGHCAFYLFIRQPMGRKSALRREIPWILRGFQGRLSC